MFLKRSSLLLAVVVCAALHVGSLLLLRIRPAHERLEVQVDGQFATEGWYKGEPFVTAKPVRAWGSWCGSDVNNGAITIGPFPAPAGLQFAVGGYPTREGNEVVVELTSTKERQRVVIATDVGERWRIVTAPLPASWVGQPVSLVAIDRAKGLGGWLAITEPIRGVRADGYAGLLETFSAWAVNALLLGLLWQLALNWLARRGWLAPQWLPLAAAGVVATGGYVAFWIYFASALAGKIFSAALLGVAVTHAWRRAPLVVGPEGLEWRDVARVGRLMLGIGALHLSLLQLYPSPREFDDLAANRYRERMPGDNTLPYNLAQTFFEGGDPRVPNAEWQSSDRPPLQSGWLLLTWPATHWLGMSPRAAAGTSAVWFQLLWVAAAYGLLRTLCIAAARAAAWTAVIGLSGFCVQNTIFTWPKLSAAAFACGAFGLWVMPAPDARSRGARLVGAGLASLGWLSHGGVAFSYLALAPWIAWQIWRGGLREWLLAAGVFLLFALPWSSYQKIYEPPGNKLLKMHLAGSDVRDARGVWQTMRDGYHALSWQEIGGRRLANLATQVRGDWPRLFDFSVAGASSRRGFEFFHPARALAWWLLGIAALPLLWWRRMRHRESSFVPWAHVALAVWPLTATLVWCLMMFVPTHAVIHQGSYAVMLAFFVVLSAWLELATRWSLPLIALLQTATLATTYGVPNELVNGAPLRLPALLLAAVALAWLVASDLLCERRAIAAPAPGSE